MTNNSHQDEKVRRGLAWPNRARERGALCRETNVGESETRVVAQCVIVRPTRAIYANQKPVDVLPSIVVERKSHISPWAS